MKNILLPVDGSKRSLRSLEAVKRLFPPEKTSVTVLTVAPGLVSAGRETEILGVLADCAAYLEEYETKTVFLRGVAGAVIVGYAKEKGCGTIVMTRSSRGPLHKMGSVTAYVAKHADEANLVILRELTQ